MIVIGTIIFVVLLVTLVAYVYRAGLRANKIDLAELEAIAMYEMGVWKVGMLPHEKVLRYEKYKDEHENERDDLIG